MSELILNGTSAQLGYTVPFTSVYAGKYATEDKSNRDTTKPKDNTEKESPAITDKPARRESLPKIAPIRRAYNDVADNTGLSSCV